MPVKKAAFKSIRQDKKRASSNMKSKSDVNALVRKVRKSVETNTLDKAKDFLTQAIKQIDKAQQKGVLKKNTAARKKSRLSKLVNKPSK